MHKKLLSISLVVLLIFALVSCKSTPNDEPNDPNTSESSDEPPATAPVSISNNGRMIWDVYLDENSDNGEDFTFTIDEIPEVRFERKAHQAELFADDEHLVDGCMSIYISDFTGDGIPELCLGESLGSGIVTESVCIIDYTTGNAIFGLSDRGSHDYYFFLRNGVLCVKETDYWEKDTIRTGVLYYDGESQTVEVSWDDTPDYTPDEIDYAKSASY